MKTRTLTTLLLLLSTSCGTSPATNAAVDPVPREPLERAHEAYLEGDLVKMTRSLRDVLAKAPVDADVERNAYRLLDAAYTREHGTLPVDWALPRGLTRLELGAVLAADAGGRTRLGTWVSGMIDDPARLQGIVVRRGTEVLFDEVGGVGRLAKVEPQEDGQFLFSIERDGGPPLDPGVYELEIRLKDLPPTLGWVIVSSLAPTAVPRIRAPLSDAVGSGNPTFAIDEMFSSSYQPFERRTLWIGVSRNDVWEWQLWTPKPGTGDIVLGDNPRGKPTTTLAPGRHWVGVQCAESRQLGPVVLTRAGRSTRPFRVE